MEPRYYDEGGMWEEPGFEIRWNEPISENGGGAPCRHCHSERVVTHTRYWDPHQSTWEERVWICPRIVVASNEGGHNSTGVCLDCLLELGLKLPPAPRMDNLPAA